MPSGAGNIIANTFSEGGHGLASKMKKIENMLSGAGNIIQSLRAIRRARGLASGSWRNDAKRTTLEGTKTTKGRTTNDSRIIEKWPPKRKNETRIGRRWFKNAAKTSRMQQIWSQAEQKLEADRARWLKTAPRSRRGGSTRAIPYNKRPYMDTQIYQNRKNNIKKRSISFRIDLSSIFD